MEKLKIFQKNKEYLGDLGISLNADTGPSRTFNRSILFGLFSVALVVVVDFIYIIFYEANTFWEVTQSIYFCYLSIDMPISYALLVFRAQTLFEFTVNIENAINECKLFLGIEIKLCKCENCKISKNFLLALLCYPVSKALINETNRRVEKTTQIIHFVLVFVTPMCGILPHFMYVYLTYFTTDLGTEAFELPCPMW